MAGMFGAMNDLLTGRSERIAVDGASFNVRRWGDSSGRPFLFLHSLGPAASAALLGPGVGPIADAGFAVAAPDMPGFGRTPPLPAERYEVGALARLVWSLVDRLGWDRIVLSGHSWGGAVASHVAAADPGRVGALVLVDSGHIDYANSPGADLTQSLESLAAEAEGARRRAKDAADVAAQLEIEPGDPLVEAILEGMVDDGAGGLISATTGLSRASAMYHLMRARSSDTWSTTAGAGIPTLLLLATKPDETRQMNEEAAARFATAIPHADVRFIDGATHSMVTDLRDRFGTLVADWLSTTR
jgi:pimeloyl-ACP methyl ester carboxylesterase